MSRTMHRCNSHKVDAAPAVESRDLEGVMNEVVQVLHAVAAGQVHSVIDYAAIPFRICHSKPTGAKSECKTNEKLDAALC